jgi:methyl-accepting chemotaxis protein
MKLIHNLALSRKFALIALLALVMVVMPTTLTFRAALQSVQASRDEAAGLDPARQLVALLRIMQQHRAISESYLSSPDANAAERNARLGETEAQMAKTLEALANVHVKVIEERSARLHQDWTTLAGAVAARSIKGEESNARHGALVGQIIDLIAELNDATGMAFENDPALYYLLQGVTLHLPRVTEVLAEMRSSGALLLAMHDASPAEKANIAKLGEIMSIRLHDARNDLVRAGAFDATLVAPLQASITAAVDGSEGIVKLASEQIVKSDSLGYSAGDFRDAATKSIDAQFDLENAAFKLLGERLQANADHERNALVAMILVLLVAGGFAASVLWIVATGTTRAIGRAVLVAETVAAGDLTSEIVVTSTEETGRLLQALKNMNDNLGRVVGQVRASSDSIATGSSQIATGNTDLSQRTEEQAASLEQTAASMDEMNASVRNNADVTRQASDLASSASVAASQGGEAVDRVVSTMQAISSSSSKIESIIGVIDGIAFQTNILALNAAVEAARAGTHGRGFAVVATEVRSLAQRCADAAREIKQLIGVSVEQVESGTTLAADAGAAMQRIVDQVRRVEGLIGEISTASNEQASGIHQVSEAVAQLDRVTQQNAALVEESAAAAQSLQQQTQALTEAVSVFRVSAARA